MTGPHWIKAYRGALRVLPRWFLAEAEEDLVDAFQAGLTASRRPLPRASFLCRTALDLAVTAVHTRRDAMARTLPGTTRRWGMRSMIEDVAGAWRTVRRSPGFVAVVVLTLAVGIGASTTMFSVVSGVLLTPLELEAPEDLFAIWGSDVRAAQHPMAVADLQVLRAEATAFVAVEGRWTNRETLIGDGPPEQVSVAWSSTGYLAMLGVEPLLGRHLSEADVDELLMSHAMWVRRFGSDPGVVGIRIQFGASDPLTVVGVLPPDVNPDLPSTSGVREQNDFWRLMPPAWLQGDDWGNGWIRVVARIRPGAGPADAQADLNRLAGQVAKRVPARSESEFRYDAVPVTAEIVAEARPLLLILLGAVVLVLLIACFNVANLMLVRSEARAGELAIRSALGGVRRDLVRHLVAESAILASLGATGGAAIAWGGVTVIRALGPANLPRLDTIAVDADVFGFAFLAAGLSAIIFGVLPAFRVTRGNVAGALATRGASQDRPKRRLSETLVVAEVAISLVLLAGTGLLLQSLLKLHSIRPGFETERILTFGMTVPGPFETPDAAVAHQRLLVDAMRGTPGVITAGLSNRIPLGGGLFAGPYAIDEVGAAAQNHPLASFRFVTPEYLTAMGTRLMAGRFLTQADGPDAVLVDERLAKRQWPEEDAVGQRIWTGELGRNGDWSTIVGVVEHMRHADLTADGHETVFFPWTASNFIYAAVRTRGAPDQVLDPLTASIQAFDPTVAIASVRSMERLVADAVAPNRLALTLLAVFATVAVLLSAIGLYGVIAYGVRRRTREIGIRKALGAESSFIMRQVLAQGMTMVLIGTGFGLVGALVFTRLLSGLLYDTAPTHIPTLLAVAGVAILAGLGGTILPARRATRVSPIEALREE